MEGIAVPFQFVKEGLDALLSPLVSIANYLNPFSDEFIFKPIQSACQQIVNWLNPLSEDFFLYKLINLVVNIVARLDPTSDDFLLKDVFSFLGEILSYINPFSENFFVYKLIELLGDLLKWLFVPSEDSINSLVDSVKGKFAFVDTINNTITIIQDMFSGTESLPVIKITLPENNWYNGEVTVIDLNWYTPYKQYGDIIITAFIYVFFIWRIYINLSSIISGAGGAINDLPQQVGDIEAYNKFGFGRRSSLNRKQFRG